MNNGKGELSLVGDGVCAAQGQQVPGGWEVVFLEVLAETSNVSRAARVAKIGKSQAYRKRRSDAKFARDWHAALMEGYEHLELEVLHRLRQGSSPTGRQRKYDNSAALRLLALHRETIDRMRAERNDRSEIDVLAEINARIDLMRARQKEREEQQESGSRADNGS